MNKLYWLVSEISANIYIELIHNSHLKNYVLIFLSIQTFLENAKA